MAEKHMDVLGPAQLDQRSGPNARPDVPFTTGRADALRPMTEEMMAQAAGNDDRIGATPVPLNPEPSAGGLEVAEKRALGGPVRLSEAAKEALLRATQGAADLPSMPAPVVGSPKAK